MHDRQSAGEDTLDSVVIGADPHKHSVTIEIVDTRERVLHKGRYGTDSDGYRQMLAAARRFEQRRWAVEGCNGIGRHVAQRLVADGETVVDVPAKLAARARVFDTGNGRKTDPADAHSVAVVALRSRQLTEVRVDDELVALRLLVDRRDELGRTRTQTINRLHRLLLELIPGGAKRFLTAAQAQALLDSVAPTDVAGKVRHQLATELLAEIVVLDAKMKASDKTLRKAVTATGTGLLDLYGIGPPARPASSATSPTSPASPPGPGSPPGTAPHPWTPHPARRNGIGCPGPATGASTGRCTSWPSSRSDTTPTAAPTSDAASPAARRQWRHCAPSKGDCPMWSIDNWSPT